MEPDMADSIEIPLEDVERIAGELGFKTLRREVVFAGFNTDLRCGRRSELAIPRGSARR
jgi:hypothetical protein